MERVVLVAGAVAFVAEQVHVAHKLHAHRHVAFALAGVAAATFDVEREEAALVATGFRQRLLGVECAYLVEDLHVGGGVGAGGAADGVLVHHLDRSQTAHVALERET